MRGQESPPFLFFCTSLFFPRTRKRKLAGAFAQPASLCYTSYMPDFAAPVERLTAELKHLPGIGKKTAQRLAFFLLRPAPKDALGLADATRDAKEKTRECSTCHNVTDADPCLY